MGLCCYNAYSEKNYEYESSNQRTNKSKEYFDKRKKKFRNNQMLRI